MNVNFELLKSGFLEYLRDKNISTGKNVENIDINIFSYGNEFREYVKKELNIDSSQIGINIFDLGNMEVVNGELVKKDENSQTKTGTNGYNILTDLLNDVMKQAEVFKSIDKNSDGNIDRDEASNFFKFISNNDNDSENVSIDDVLVAMEQMKNGTYTGETTEGSIFTDENSNSGTLNSSSDVPTGNTLDSGTDYLPSGNGSDTGSGNLPDNNADKGSIPDYSKLTLEELNSAKTEKQTSLKNAIEEMNSVYTGQNEAVSAANETLKEKKEAYLNAMKNDEAVSDEIKSKISENDTAISEKENLISDINVNISQKDSEIYEKTSSIEAKKSDISALESSSSTLSSQTSDDEEIQKSINAQKQAVDAQLKQLRSELEKEEAALKVLNEEKIALEKELETEEKALSTLEDEKTALEKELSANCNEETKTALAEYNTAKVNAEKVKNEALTAAKETVADIKAETDEINKNINSKNAERIKSENRVSSNKIFDENTQYETAYINDGTTMPYLLIAPTDVKPGEELPVLVYLHGSGEVGKNGSALLSVGPGKIMNEWDLTNFRGYVICPQLTGNYNVGNWSNEQAETYIRDLLTDFESDHAVDKSRISIAGHSLGGKGTIYLSERMDDVFYRAAVLSGFDTKGANLENISVPIKGFVGKNDTQSSIDYMTGKFAKAIGSENVSVVKGGHGAVPYSVLKADSDGNGQSDFFEWLFADE